MKNGSINQMHNTLESSERRDFIETTAKLGFTAAILSAAGCLTVSCKEIAAVLEDEKKSEKQAKVIMYIATAYRLGASRSYPIMQLDFKENIQNFSNNEIYVKLIPSGQLGAGGVLAQKVQAGTLQAAQHSLANFATFAPIVDLINVPYWCGKTSSLLIW